ncbi:ACP synthase CitX [Treponema sp. OMZ 838]|uniref:citrate lyase holo-[acyl-carrier protein] synthase n=1 Tax=Treponema TaxID=157 RepID=UPI00053011DB|nr:MULTISPECIES: citrate lyase holo-[acyl-carrier protein] synthase [Treponema]AIW89581.1 ACP synthase CitX [Treponema sp. OMZ 838]UTC47850.1 citrate lyase holo-[acyl-carrier protein] synthase [Treponema vincentii]
MNIFTEGIPQTVQDMAALRGARREQQARLFRLAETESEHRLGSSLPEETPNQTLPVNKTVVMFSLVIPGPIKNNRFLEAVFDEGCRVFLDRLVQEQPYTDEKPSGAGSVQTPLIAAHYEDRAPAGCTAFWLLNAHAETVKRQTVALERTHPIGILWDFDVFSAFEQKLSASELGLSSRPCLICGNPAKLCARSRTHSVPEMQAKISKLISVHRRILLDKSYSS